jgi:hypothetical protein
MKHDDHFVSHESPPEAATVATSGDSLSLEKAMAAVLKAVKPLDALVKAQNQAVALRAACWETLQPLCVLPETEDRSLVERFVQTAQSAYLTWFDASRAAEGHKRNLRAAEQELTAAREAFKTAYHAALKDEAQKGSNVLNAASHMNQLLENHYSQLEKNVREEQPTAELGPQDEEALAKLQSAAVDFILTEALIDARHAVLKPLSVQIYTGARLGDVALPVRPLEEEIVRYLSNLENNLQRFQDLCRKAHPLLKDRLALLGNFEVWQKAWDDAVAKATDDANPSKLALHPYVEAMKFIISKVVENSAKAEFRGYCFYEREFATSPDTLEINDRPKSTAVERDQIDYLRKQMRVVAFAVAHREEAAANLKNFTAVETSVIPRGVTERTSWADCLVWFEELRVKRDAADLENLSSSTKGELLKSSVEHWTAKAIDEMTTLYKSFQAMIPRRGPTPSNELRKLLDQAAHMCKPLEKPVDHDRY